MASIYIRSAHPADAPVIAALVRRFEALLVVDPVHAAPFWASMSEPAHQSNLVSPRFAYGVAELEGQWAGFIALRDGAHLYNLFVQPECQRRGVATALWRHARQRASEAGAASVTVNASLNAVPVYRALGFRESGEPRRQQGVAFLPMVYTMGSEAA